MAGQVVLYFEDQADALRFALAAGSVMAGEAGKVTTAGGRHRKSQPHPVSMRSIPRRQRNRTQAAWRNR